MPSLHGQEIFIFLKRKCSFKNLIREMKEISQVTEIDFQYVKVIYMH